ncbi:hypothetical protein PV797_00900 [Clostridiaceae bacterium M8S5]|nr:hypothetical protein PV797_00900 [Clostridiaceae bacterium M8S5]
MKSLSVIPHVGIGPLRLGMSPKQILVAINQIRSEWSLPDNREIQISKDIEDDGFSLRYIDASFFFMVRYRNNRAVEVAVDYELREHAIIMLYDMDVFQTLAERLVASLKQYSSCSYDMEDEQLSTNYEFNDIGIRLWREEPFHSKLLSDGSYMKEMALVIDEMYRYLYFEIIAVKL